MKNKKIVSINTHSFGSTGRIMQEIANEAILFGYDTDLYVSKNGKALYSDIKINNINTRIGDRASVILNKATGLEGCFSVLPTIRLIKKIDRTSPDIIHLHNLHHGYVNLPILFHYLKKKKIPVVWTLHDCWAFTGHCPHFIYEKCEKWKSGCFKCLRYQFYPRSLYDNSRFMWYWKKKWFSDLENLTLVTPSEWLSGLIKESFLKEYPVYSIYNGIDLDIFKPTPGNVRKDYLIDNNKKIILGVASSWSVRKGLDVFVTLSKRLSKEYQIILVGTDENTESTLPDNIISIRRTENQVALAQLYSVADVFVNPTREDTFPTVNLESLACGTPVITFNTGGSPESIDKDCGIVVPCDCLSDLEDKIIYVCDNKPFSSKNCRKRAMCFEARKQYKKYIDIYNL